MNPEEIVEKFRAKFGAGILESRIEIQEGGTKKIPYHFVWLHVDKNIFHDVVKFLAEEYPYPHLAVTSGVDLGSTIQLTYHFTIGYGARGGETPINIQVDVPKENPVIPTITDIIPCAVITEGEKQEFLGIKVEGIPESRVFIADDFPKDVHPWRKDEKGIKPEMVKKLWEVGRPKYQPAPAQATEKEGSR